jgi:GNAT superfamily N-acetyltransferase
VRRLLQGHTGLTVDLALSRRLEQAEGAANARFVEARARIMPEVGAGWTQVAGAYAMFDGPRSPCTQTFGLGLFQLPTAEDMGCIEAFFRDRGATVCHEVSPLADPAILPLLHARGYRPIELTSVMYLPLAAYVPSAPPSGVSVRKVADHERDLWARTNAAGWSDQPGVADLVTDLARIIAARDNAADFLAEIDAHPVAAGALAIHEGVALLAGASTIPAWRHRGAQRALLQARLDYGVHIGCDLAMLCAAPGTESQRNGERQGFRIAYTRIKWELPAPVTY